ncbi:MAG: O-antigen ligase family protein [Candidatus Rifleibacteriota bacterium]
MVAEKRFSDFLPLVFLGLIIGFVPLVVYLHLVEYDTVSLNLHGRPNSVNFFTYYKALWLYVLTGSAMLWFVANRKSEECWAYPPMIVYAFLAVLSTVFSKHPNIALLGNADRHEGLLTEICYLAIAFLSINLVRGRRQLVFTMFFLLFSASILGILGVCQFLGYDYFFGGFADSYLIPEYFRSVAPDFKVAEMGPRPEEVFLTFGNGNFTGSYMTMLFSLSFGLILGLKKKMNFLLIPFNLLFFINLVCSKSRAGILGAVVAVCFALFIFRGKLKERATLLLVLMLLYLGLIFAMDIYSSSQNKHLIKSAFGRSAVAKSNVFGNFERLQLNGKLASVVFDGLELKIRNNDSKVEFLDSENNLVPHRMVKKSDFSEGEKTDSMNSQEGIGLASSVLEKKDNLTYSDKQSENSAIHGISQEEKEKLLVLFPQEKMRGYVIFAWPEKNLLQIGRGGVTFNLAYTERGFQILDQLGRPASLKEVESFGFSGLETFASSRGYIWSRSIPILKKTFLIGFGPDNFFANFPNHDYPGKLRYLSNGIQKIVDKPHNWYLQIAINTGVLSLFAFLIIIFYYFYQSLKIFFSLGNPDSIQETIGKPVFLAIVSYLVVSLFNDSMIAVAPVFWFLLGVGISLNRESKSPQNWLK